MLNPFYSIILFQAITFVTTYSCIIFSDTFLNLSQISDFSPSSCHRVHIFAFLLTTHACQSISLISSVKLLFVWCFLSIIFFYFFNKSIASFLFTYFFLLYLSFRFLNLKMKFTYLSSFVNNKSNKDLFLPNIVLTISHSFFFSFVQVFFLHYFPNTSNSV